MPVSSKTSERTRRRLAVLLVRLDRRHRQSQEIECSSGMEVDVRRVITLAFIAVLLGGLLATWNAALKPRAWS